MLLAIDVGNTDIKLGIFAGEELRAAWRWSTDRAKMADEYAAYLAGFLRTTSSRSGRSIGWCSRASSRHSRKRFASFHGATSR
jgi:pantothenate kinase type III